MRGARDGKDSGFDPGPRGLLRRRLAAALVLLGACASGSAGEAKVDARPSPPPAAEPGGTATPPEPAASAPAAAPDPRAFTLAAFKVDLPMDSALVAAVKQEQWQACFDLAANLRSTEPLPAEQSAAYALVAGVCASELGRWDDAERLFTGRERDLPQLTDFILYQAARAAYFAHHPDAAAELAARVDPTSRQAADAELLRADLLRARGTPAEIAAAYRGYLDARPRGPRRAEAMFRLAEAHAAAGAPAEAVTLCRAILIEAPLSAWAAQARPLLDAERAKLGAKARDPFVWSAKEWITHADVLFGAMRNPESEAAYDEALKAKGLTAAERCEASLGKAQSIFKQRQRMRSAPVFEATVDLCKGFLDKQVRAAYQAGRAYQYDSADASARASIRWFERVEALDPKSSLADDARLRQAEGWAKLRGADPKADEHITKLLSSLPDAYPEGDMRGEALWRLAWRAFKAGDDAEAIRWLDQQIAKVPRDYNWWGEGQAQYWRGRALMRQGKKAEALASYEDAIRTYPLAYYALLAFNRLRETWPERAGELKAELAKPPAGFVPGTPAFRFAPRDVWATPGFARAKLFIATGLGDEAAGELAALGLTVPSGRARVTDADKAEELWATALLYDHAGWYDKSHWIARWSVLDYKDAWPTAANAERWRIAYPKAWWSILDGAAQREGYPTELLIAFVREESAFDPIQESWANAIGLTQMIKPTAERFGKGLGFPMTRENLRDPQKNVDVGSRFLAYLWKIFAGRVSLLVPSYNAGEGATWRWLCERGTWAADEFGEEIPHDEARNYTKRVMNSYFVYAYLKDGTIPEVPNDIPPGAINPKKCKPKAP